LVRLAYRLAATTGRDEEEILRWPVERLQRWAAFWRLEPFGSEWWILARLGTLIASFGGGSGVGMDEFLPTPKAEQSMEQALAILDAWLAKAGSNGRRAKRRRKRKRGAPGDIGDE
jgi:hypothetical protein